MNIYTPIPITESLISKFKPCRLYIKELAGIKSAETKRKMGISAGGTKESIAKGNATKRQNGIDITRQLNTEEARTKSKQTCNKLADREIVKQLRDLAFKSRKKLGSGWVRKPDSWILAQIELISSSHTLES
jgi:hypothetical protein